MISLSICLTTCLAICLIFCLGLCFGSFIHVAYCRFSPDKSVSQYLFDITFCRSACPCCHHKLNCWQLIPVISMLCLKGYCYYCQCKIAYCYMVVELFIACLFVVILMDKGINYHAIFLLILACWFLLLALIDFKYYLLPDFLTQPLMWLGLILAYFDLSLVMLNDPLKMALTGILFGYLLLKVPATLFYFITKKTGLGNGDVKLLAALGAWIPYLQLPLLLIISSILGIIYYLVLRYCFNNKSLKIIPFGPFLLIAGYLMLYFCQDVSGDIGV